jgi:hypothetical protein
MYRTSISAFFTVDRKNRARLSSMKTEMDGYEERADLGSLNAEASGKVGSDMIYYLLDCISSECSRAINKIRKRKKNQIQLY